LSFGRVRIQYDRQDENRGGNGKSRRYGQNSNPRCEAAPTVSCITRYRWRFKASARVCHGNMWMGRSRLSGFCGCHVTNPPSAVSSRDDASVNAEAPASVCPAG
jgi:hypothetical protein